MKVGLFFGSFNPIHIGHLIIANSICEQAKLDEVWFVVSPLNPFKGQGDMAPANLRLSWVEQSVIDNPKLKASGIELDLPIPSYTYQTLDFLKSDEHTYHLIMGSDTFLSLPKWKNAADFIYSYPIEIYQRPHSEIDDMNAFPLATLHDLPELEISATRLRNKCKAGNSIQYYVRDVIREEVKSFYSASR
ncbi:nicotinate (nicotinamide) nucleotide adenylyltransferase [Bacteroidia bacterium]|jgi:nicotinate-nucleotide adenylyltransferase|nr:nicotinate (nicotinamide) nucleotide adenylyltransferase [Bacteroidia bacterium]